jgi:riboflavin synthase
MFTGIVEEIGIIQVVDLDSPQQSLVIQARDVLADTHQGDSIAVNGVCLTVTSLDSGRFSVGVMAETLRRTNLRELSPGDAVNLERPVQPQSRLGGHFVQGHVDGTGKVRSVLPDGVALAVRIETERSLLRYVVEKGFIAVDGASLTVTSVDDAGFGVALIPYSQEHLARGLYSEGASVNLEVDILAKYLEKLVVH